MKATRSLWNEERQKHQAAPSDGFQTAHAQRHNLDSADSAIELTMLTMCTEVYI